MWGKYMKKYPVIYDGEEYEVRWKRDFLLPYIKMKLYKKNGILWRFRPVCIVNEDVLCNYYYLDDRAENYRVEEVKCLMTHYWLEKKKNEEDSNTIEKQKEVLRKWDGVI